MIGDIILNVYFVFSIEKFNESVLVEGYFFSKYLILYNLICRIFGKNIIVIIVHHFDYYGSNDKFFLRRWFYKLRAWGSLILAEKLVTGSKYSKDEISSLGIDLNSVLIIPPGIDRQDLEVYPRKDDSDSKVKLLCVSHLTPRKGIFYLIEAFEEIDNSMAELHIVGNMDADIKYTHKVNKLIDKLNLHDKIVLHGRIDQNRLNEIFSNSDLFIFPSLLEGFGIVLLEAMYFGLPIVAANVSAIPELVEDGENGFLVEPANSQSLAAGISELITNSKLRTEMSRESKKRLENSYFWHQTTDKFYSYVSELIFAVK